MAESSRNRVSIGVVGCGYWGPNIIRNFYEQDQTDLAWVCDKDDAKLDKIGRRYPTVKLTGNVDDLLNDASLDAVVIVTPVHTHYPLAKKALEAGKHVLIEKPMCLTTQESLELIRLAEAAKLTLMVDHTFVYHGAVRRMKAMVDSGELGDILYFDSTRINLGLFQSDINVIWDLAPHDLSVMDYLTGQTPVAVHAIGSSHAGNGIENIAYITLTYDGPMISHFNMSWLSPVKIRQILLGGTKKMIVYDDLQPMEKVRIYDKGITIQTPQDDEERYQQLVGYRMGDMSAPALDLTEALKTMTGHFVECILTGQKPLTDGYAGLRVVQILEASDVSLKTGQPQPLQEITPISDLVSGRVEEAV